MEEKGQSFQPQGQEGARSCVETGAPGGGVYAEREDSKFSFGTSESLSIKLRKDQSLSNQISNELIGLTNLY